MPPSDALRVAAAVVGSVAVTLPFLVVEVPPITDLPQQVAQVRLLGEALGGSPEVRVQWLHPNRLGYLPILLLWPLGPLAAGRLAVAAIAVAWSVAAHRLAAALGRPPGVAALAALFVFDHVVYWGFLNFAAGLPVFVAWWLHLERQGRDAPDRRRGLVTLLLAGLLYAAHVLWLAAGTAWLVAGGALARTPPAALARRLAWTLPWWLAVAAWYPRLAGSGFVSETFQGGGALARLRPEWIEGAVLGGLRSPVEETLLAVVAAWVVVGLWQHRRRPLEPATQRLLVAAAGFAAAALLLPGVVQNTIFFASRWAPVAALLAVVALPAPRPPRAATALALVVAVGYGAVTAGVWRGFERHELQGLAPSLAAAPPGGRLLGIDLVRESPRVDGYPYYHLYAWAQALHGGELATSFANHGSSLVVFRDLPRRHPWTEGLDWRARRLRRSDLPHFDAVLVHGDAAAHAPFAADPRLVPATPPARWRLYRVRPEAAGTSLSSAATSASTSPS